MEDRPKLKSRIGVLQRIAASNLRVVVAAAFVGTVFGCGFCILFPSVKYWGSQYVRDGEFDLIHNWFSRRHPFAISDHVVVVTLDDEKSILEVGPLPWSAFRYAELINRLTEYGASVIGFDAFVEEKPSRLTIEHPTLPTITILHSQDGELAFQAAVRRHG